jgi:hypothetical protein
MIDRGAPIFPKRNCGALRPARTVDFKYAGHPRRARPPQLLRVPLTYREEIRA